MKKLFYYELKRLIKNRFFLALLLITVVYSWQTITGEMVLGMKSAAPFSGWSVGFYFTEILPILLIVEVFFLTYLFGEREQGMEQLRRTTDFPQLCYGLLRFAVIGIGILLLTIVVLLMQLFFCQHYFQAGTWQQMLLPQLFCLLPAFFLVLGIGMLAGELHRNLLYGLMLLFLCGNVLGPLFGLDLTGMQFFLQGVSQVPADTSGEPLFFLLPWAVRQRAFYLLLGLILSMIGLVNHFLVLGNERLGGKFPITQKQAVSGLVLLIAFFVLFTPIRVKEVTEVAATAYAVETIDLQGGPYETAAPIATEVEVCADEAVDMQAFSQNAAPFDIMQQSFTGAGGDKCWQEYQQWGLQQTGDGAAQWHGQPVSQILDCNGNYSSYGQCGQTGANLYIKRNIWGQIDDILELSSQELLELLN